MEPMAVDNAPTNEDSTAAIRVNISATLTIFQFREVKAGLGDEVTDVYYGSGP